MRRFVCVPVCGAKNSRNNPIYSCSTGIRTHIQRHVYINKTALGFVATKRLFSQWKKIMFIYTPYSTSPNPNKQTVSTTQHTHTKYNLGSQRSDKYEENIRFFPSVHSDVYLSIQSHSITQLLGSIKRTAQKIDILNILIGKKFPWLDWE